MFDVISKRIVEMMTSLGVWNDIIVNGIGVVALIFLVTSYQMRSRSAIFKIYFFSGVAWVFYFTLQGNLVSAMMNMVAMVRTIIFKRRGKSKWVDSYLTLIIFLVGMIGLTALTYRDWRDLFPLMATASQTYAFYQVKENTVRAINLVGYVGWILNGITCGYVVALICDCVTFVSLIVALIRFSEKRTQNKNGEVLQENQVPEKQVE